jgi:hypothetical protein
MNEALRRATAAVARTAAEVERLEAECLPNHGLETVIRKVNRWYPSEGQPHEWEAICGSCYKLRPAIELVSRTLPFGRGHRWVCKDGCDVEV